MDWHDRQNEPASSRPDLLDQDFIPRIGQHDHIPGVDVASQDQGFHKRG
jgi:hypothetical protein